MRLYASQTADFHFDLCNVGHWFGKPAATNNSLYINFEEAFDLLSVRYGSNLECVATHYDRGKNNSKYFKIGGVHLYYGEPAESVVVRLQAPHTPGTYQVWVASRSDQSDHGVHTFAVEIVSSEREAGAEAAPAKGPA